MARPTKIINIGISWTGFILAVLVSLAVVLALLWIKRNKSLQIANTANIPVRIEPFLSFRGFFKKQGRGIRKAGNTVFRIRTAVSTCNTAITDSKKPSEKEVAKNIPNLQCGNISNRTKKPTSKQADLAIHAIAIKFTKIFNDNSNQDTSADLRRSKFVNLIVKQCESSRESRYEEIRSKLVNKSTITINDAKDIMKIYPCVRTFIESMSIRIQNIQLETPESGNTVTNSSDIVNSGVETRSLGNIDTKTNTSVNNNVTDANAEDMVENAELEAILKDIDPDLEDKLNEILYSDCDPLDRCITGALIDETYDSDFNELAKQYSEDLAFDLFVTNSEIYNDPENKKTIEEPMEPLPQNDTVVSSTSPSTSYSEFYGCFSGKPSG
jgi:hypothetical protein